LTADHTVDVDAGGGEHDARRQTRLAAALARDDHAVRGRVEQILPVVLDEHGGVGPRGVRLDVQDPLGGHAAGPVTNGVGDRADEVVEAVGGGGGVVEVSDGCAHGPHGNKDRRVAGTASQCTAGTDTVRTIRVGTSP
jgi:hypothetical protein